MKAQVIPFTKGASPGNYREGSRPQAHSHLDSSRCREVQLDSSGEEQVFNADMLNVAAALSLNIEQEWLPTPPPAVFDDEYEEFYFFSEGFGWLLRLGS